MLTTWETLKYNKNNFLLPPSTSFIATLSEKGFHTDTEILFACLRFKIGNTFN